MPPEPAAPAKPETVAEKAETARDLRPFALAAFTATFLGLCVYLAIPFLPALAWGIALAVIAWPLQTWLARHVKWRGLAAGLTTAIVAVSVVVPSVFVSYQVAREGADAAEKVREETAEKSLQQKAEETPGVSGPASWLTRIGVDLDREVHRIVESNTRDISTLAQGSIMALVQFAIAMFILFHLLLDRSSILGQLKGLMPLDGAEYDRVVAHAADSVHANLRATLVTSVIDGVGGGLMFWLLGVPSPVTWAAVMFFLSFLPLLGTWLIWIPATAFLAMAGHYWEAGVLIAWGIASAFVVDNAIYIRVAGDRMRLHQVPALLAFLGGLALFGTAGMILGPGILAITVALLDVWRRRVEGIRPSAPEGATATAAPYPAP
jgi:predicted PurR-regulated permease PerM